MTARRPTPPGSRIYLGSRYSRLDELNDYAEQLRSVGFVVDARWLTGEHGSLTEQTSHPEGDHFARICGLHDVEDVRRAHTLISFTDPPDFKSPRGRGGLHVEWGLAIAWDKRLILVGHRVHVFHHLPQIEFYATWGQAFSSLREGK